MYSSPLQAYETVNKTTMSGREIEAAVLEHDHPALLIWSLEFLGSEVAEEGQPQQQDGGAV